MDRLAWDARFELGVRRMDDTHREFVALVNALQAADDGSFASRLEALIEHTVEHFDQENRWMAASSFGPPCHTAEHHNVLELMREVQRRVLAGDLEVGRRLAAELGPWFEHHASTMDTILASHMVQVGFDPDREAPASASAAA
jgi:hemerythrin-like metal-binding protein